MLDTTFNESSMDFAVGFLVFDPGGMLWAAGFHKINPPGSVMAVELHAIKDGADFWKSHGQGEARIFSDSIDAINSLLNEDQ